MEPNIINKGKIILVGLVDCGIDAGDINIGGLWQDFEKNENEIKNKVEGVGYELHTDLDNENIDEKHICLVGVEVNKIEDIPVEYFIKVLPSTKYVVFTHCFKNGGFNEAFKMAYEWLEKSNYSEAYPYDIQYYDKRFYGPDDPESIIDIYIPIK